MRKIRLNDGHEFAVNLCIDRDGVLWLGFDRDIMTISEAVGIFTPAATERIVEVDAFGENRVYEHFTEITTINRQGDIFLISLRRVVPE